MNYRLLYCLLLVSTCLLAKPKPVRLFSDHVVLQRQKPIPVWGWASPREEVTVTLAGQSRRTKANTDGKWLVTFAPMEAGGPHDLTIRAKSGEVAIHDVLIGEVWLCSGQSNMEFRVDQADNYAAEKRNTNFPQIRHFYVEHELALTPEQDLKKGDWKVCSSETVGGFTAVGFFFARELTQKLNVPIGLLHSSWGGSQLEGWLSKEGMLENEELRTYAQHLPTTWVEVDSLMDQKLKKQLLGSVRQPTRDDEKKYLAVDYDFANWRRADPLGQWAWKDMRGFKGEGYMARVIDIPADMVGKPTTLGLAQNDSPNQIYINGKLVSEGVLEGTRKIELPANTWQPGENRLVVKFGSVVNPTWFGMGVQGSPSDLYVASGPDRISLAGEWRLMPAFAEPHSYIKFMNNVGTTIYNSMIAPLVPFAIRGTLWYQGESNAGRSYQYRQSFPLLITDWRSKWGQNGKPDDFSFYFVQLASYGAEQSSNKGSGWAELREAQTQTLKLPKTGMAVTIDVGNPKDIHPTNKQDVGHRLALQALKQDFGQNIAYSSPMFESVTFEDGKAIVTFSNVDKGLVANDKYGYLKGFEVAGADKQFHYAKAEIAGNKVIVYHPNGQKPVTVRYAWADSPIEANLFNSAGLPANPFRTDDWPGLTLKAKFE
ncbi:sialate O-acetylesterase [Spirosoma pomorum]